MSKKHISLAAIVLLLLMLFSVGFLSVCLFLQDH